MRPIAVVTVLGLLALGGRATAQDSVTWLVGRWSEQIRKGATARTPRDLQFEVSDGLLRVIEISQDGDEFRCRLDETETRSTQVKSKATVEYILKCKVSGQSLEVRGRSVAFGMSGIPPQQFEIERKYDVAKDGSLRARLRLRGVMKGVGAIDLVDERTDFSRSR